MLKIPAGEVRTAFEKILLGRGCPPEHARKVAFEVARNSLEGTYTHGINRFARLVRGIDDGTLDMKAEPVLINAFGALENYDGGLGFGIVNAWACIGRAIELAKEHGIPFYVAAPSSTVDLTLESGSLIEIEERDPRELEGFTVSGVFEPGNADESRAFDLLTKEGPYAVPLQKGHAMVIERKGGAYSFDAWFKMTPPGIEIYNPAFDVTPGELITAFITERGVVRPEPDYTTALSLNCAGCGGMHELDSDR